MLKPTAVTLAALVALTPIAASAETQTLNCMVGKKPMTLVYEGDNMGGTLSAKTPWGDMKFDGVIYAGGDPVGEFTFLSSGPQASVVMPDLAKLEACVKQRATAAELMDAVELEFHTTYCVSQVPDGAPVPAIVEINASVIADYGIDVDVYRTYAAESPVANGHLVVLLPEELQPQCTVVAQ